MPAYNIQNLSYPLDQYLNGLLSEKDEQWNYWKWDVKRARRSNPRAVREILTPYYRRLFMADKGFFLNGNTDTHVKNALVEFIECEGNDAGRLFNDLDLVKAAENWAERLRTDNHEPRYFFLLLMIIQKRDYRPDWEAIYQEIHLKLAKARNFGNFKTHELYCLVMGLTMIERTSLPRERKNELFFLMKKDWGFMKYMYSVLIHYIVGMRGENFAAVASSICKLGAARPHMHLFYKAFRENFDQLCPEGQIDPHSGQSVRQQAKANLLKMEEIIKTTPPSTELEELCSILFPKVMKEVLKQSRPKTYEELEAAVDDLTNRYNRVLEQLTNAVREVESDQISADDLAAAFLRFPKDLALGLFGSVSTLLAQNQTWLKYSPLIHEQILNKQEEARTIQVAGDYVVTKHVEHVVEHVDKGGTGISVNRN